MKTLPIILLLSAASNLFAASYGQLVRADPDHPEKVIAGLQQLSYDQKAEMLKETYSEFERTGDPIDQLGIAAIPSLVKPKESVSLYIDCAITQANLSEVEGAILGVYHLLLANPTLSDDAAFRQKIVAAITAELGSVGSAHGSAQSKFDIARYGAYILVILGSDSGLDVLLTESQEVKELARHDKWDEKNPNHFIELAQNYATQAKQRPGVSYNDLLRVAYYRLCFLRAQHGIALSPRHPLVNLDALLGDAQKEGAARAQVNGH